MIVHGGEKIYTKDLEDYISGLGGIQDVQVIGVTSDRYGEDVAACIIPASGCIWAESTIKGKAKEDLAAYMVPKHVFFMNNMPLTASLQSAEVCIR